MIPIKRIKGIEAQRSFEGVSTPNDMAELMTRLLAVDIKEFINLEEIIVSPVEPSDSDRRKIWIKSSGVPGLGLPIGGRYRMIYPYPANVPVLWTLGQDELPSYLRRLSVGELNDYELENPADTRFFYVILVP